MASPEKGQFKPIVRGLQVGAPPSLENIPVDRLQVDPDYQRVITGPKSRRLIVGMVREWDWKLCLPLLVSRRADGSLWVVDGQHRLMGARERGDIPFLPCVVQPALDPEIEARVFVGLNTRRQALSQADLFAGQLAMGDPDAKAVARILEETGWRNVRSSSTDSWRPGDLCCAPMLVKQLRINGPAPVRTALTILRAAYPDTVVTAPAYLLQALVVLVRAEGKVRGRFADRDPADLIRAMQGLPAMHWLPRAVILRHDNPALTQIAAVASAIAEQVENRAEEQEPAPRPGGQVTATLLAPLPAPVKLPPAPSAPIDGKIWCAQCESRVTTAAAAACGQRFCKARAEAA